MSIKSHTLLLICAVLTASAFAQKPGAFSPEPIKVSSLSPNRIEEVYTAPERVTTLVFDTKERITTVTMGSPILDCKYEPENNQMFLKPLIQTGETNLNLRIGRDTYVLIIHIVADSRVQYVRTFSLANDPRAMEETTAMMGAARVLRPDEIDVIQSVKTIEQARRDPVFRASQQGLKTYPMGQTYEWNHSIVYLVEVTQFAADDLLVFKVEWVNRTEQALYCDASQYGLRVANRKIPILARYQKASDSVIYPGQHEVVYLFVQGLRLLPTNNWELLLPPDADAVFRMIR